MVYKNGSNLCSALCGFSMECYESAGKHYLRLQCDSDNSMYIFLEKSLESRGSLGSRFSGNDLPGMGLDIFSACGSGEFLSGSFIVGSYR